MAGRDISMINDVQCRLVIGMRGMYLGRRNGMYGVDDGVDGEQLCTDGNRGPSNPGLFWNKITSFRGHIEDDMRFVCLSANRAHDLLQIYGVRGWIR
jgi:hypothetical protein